MKKVLTLVALALAFVTAAATSAFAQAGHEYAPLEEKTVNYKDWTLNSVKDGKPVNLRSFAQGKKLVLVVYFAPWCGNWRNEAPVAAKLYEKYKAAGLDVIGISEYAPPADTVAFFGEGGSPYTVVSESESREARDKTAHFNYRQATGDTRRWGSPYNVFLEPAKLSKTGEVLAEKAWVVNGELMEEEVENFIRARLGLDKADKMPAATSHAPAFAPESGKAKLLKATASSSSQTVQPCKEP
ncbi:MAG TPA: TlpA disulfide reductase family protein [Pyrinomonadaceae bacterium]|nr:TlpA disulfide reductase family protein [Pyrinomonadaceae bacterium]